MLYAVYIGFVNIRCYEDWPSQDSVNKPLSKNTIRQNYNLSNDFFANSTIHIQINLNFLHFMNLDSYYIRCCLQSSHLVKQGPIFLLQPAVIFHEEKKLESIAFSK